MIIPPDLDHVERTRNLARLGVRVAQVAIWMGALVYSALLIAVGIKEAIALTVVFCLGGVLAIIAGAVLLHALCEALLALFDCADWLRIVCRRAQATTRAKAAADAAAKGLPMRLDAT